MSTPFRAAILTSDTSRAAERVQVELWRRMSSVDKARAVSGISRATQEFSLVGIRQRYPDASERECTLRLAVLKLGRELALRAYPEATALLRGSPLDDTQMNRRQRVLVATDPDRHLHVYTAEDILLQKLRWYRMGDEVSDRQWRDVLGIVLVQGSALDEAYLRDGAATLGVEDLLERALREGRED